MINFRLYFMFGCSFREETETIITKALPTKPYLVIEMVSNNKRIM